MRKKECLNGNSNQLSNNHNLRFFYHNCSGMRTKLKKLMIDARSCHFDILVFTETWLNDSFFDSEILDDSWTIHRKDRNYKALGLDKGGGVIIAVKNSFCSEHISLRSDYNEYEFAFTKINLQTYYIYIGVVYFPPNSLESSYLDFLEKCKTLLSDLREEDKIFIFGDFNRNSLSFFIDDETNNILPFNFQHTIDTELISTFSDLDCHQINIHPNDNNTFLDLIFTNTYENSTVNFATDTENLFSNVKNHKALVLNFPLSKINFSQSYNNQKVYDFRNGNYEAINNALSRIDWNMHFSNNIDANLNAFYSIIYSVIDKFVPMIRKKDKLTEPWLDKNLRSLRNRRNSLYNKIKRVQVPSESLVTTHNRLAEEFKVKSNEAYDIYVNNIGNSIISNPKNFFDFVNTKRKCSGYPNTMSKDDRFFSYPEEICDAFASNFQTIYNCENNDVQVPVSIQSELLGLSNIHISMTEIFSSINELDINKSQGPDLIPPILLLNCVDNLVCPLFALFNLSLTSGVFPSLWKSSYLVPIFKNGDKTSIDNYRGIATLSTIPKLFEKIISQKITSFVETRLNEQQHGFRRNRSTTTNLMIFTSSVLCDMEKGYSVDTIYTDFKKAFDKVDHKILISKLAKFGFSGSLLKWLSSYLVGRTQIVKFQGYFSKLIYATSGVPQGSHLGPILFNIFICDLSRQLSNVNHLLFADDLKIFCRISSPEDSAFLQSKLNDLDNWCSINKLTLNVAKCNIITFSRKKKNTTHFDYFINQAKLSRVFQILDLGILLDSQLLLTPHYDRIIGKANQLLGFIKRRAKEFKNVWVTKTLYCTLVRSILEYGSIIWDPFYNDQSDRIESVQKQFLLFALRDQFDPRDYLNLPSYEHRLDIINLSPLSLRRSANVACFAFDVITGKINLDYISNKICINNPIRFTRNPRFLVEYNHRTNYGIDEPINRCCRTFNSFSHLYSPGISKNTFRNLILHNT